MHFERNLKGRDFVVGDIHGQYNLLMQNLDEVNFNKDIDRLFSVGDLIDRGPDSEKCLMLIDKPWFFAVRGNHEQMMINSIKTRDPSITAHWIGNGGDWSIYLGEDELACFAEMADSLPLFLTVETPTKVIGLVHAEPRKTWADTIESDEEHLLWSRTKIRRGDKSFCEGIATVYCGHTPLKEPTQLGNVRFIDTGAFHTNILTIEELE